MIKITETPLNTEYANNAMPLGFEIEATSEIYCDVQTLDEADGARLTEARAEDRFLAALLGALPSEVWS